ncbi:MAG: hypothetical protein IPL52_09895 [Flavobacteriales bacterium]|nr:hypothetical protein [Flavobacteriales bacterium]
MMRTFIILTITTMVMLFQVVAAGQTSCGIVSPDWANSYRHQQNYMIGAPLNPTTTAIKTIQVTVHVFRHEDGDAAVIPNLSFADTPQGRQELIDLVEQYTALPFFEQIEAPTTPMAGFTYATTDANIRFDVVDVRFIYDTDLYFDSTDPNNGDDLMVAALAEDPDSESTLHVFITRPGTPSPFAGPPPFVIALNTFDDQVWAALGPTYDSIYLVPGALDQWGGELAHELAHAVGLRHLYEIPFTYECSMSNPAEFLFDFWGIPTNPYPCWAAAPLGFCDVNGVMLPCTSTPGCACPNNILSVEAPFETNCNITPMQIGRIHRNLMVANIAKYAWGYDPVPYTLTQNETWDFPIKFYQDIVVPAGVTLTLKCELHMVPEAGVIVQPGGKLVIDGGKAQAALYAPARWRGIQVLGNSSLPQTDANQGVIEILNGGVIADAILGIRVGGSVSTQGGGIVRSQGGAIENSFVNCARAVSFQQYLYPSAPGTYAVNASYFNNTRFDVNPDFMVYPNAQPFAEHVRLNRVVGLRFNGCNFINTRTATTSAELGHGIRAQDAQFFVNGVSHMEGLDHGIHSTGMQPYGWFMAEGNVFKNNICGIYTSQPDACRIIGNRFVMGKRNVALTDITEQFWFGYHRGIFMHESFKLNIQFNVLQRDSDPLAATTKLEGIVVGYNRDYSDVVRNNRTVDLDRGFIGEGINCTTTGLSSVYGLQYRCNACQNTLVNIWSRKDVSVFPTFLQNSHSMRTWQGTPTSPADNSLDNWPFGDPLKDDFRVSTTFSPITYSHRTGAPFTPTDWSSVLPNYALLSQVASPPAYTCPTIPEPPFALAPQDPQVSKATLLSAKLAYGNVRYQYGQLIDGGHTDEVVEQIMETWPQDFLELRDYLLSKSPYLSVMAIKEAMDKPGFPDAIRAEVCIANPDATKSDGFMQWLTNDCLYPLPEYLIASIVASWDEHTYRTTLEEQMAQHHEAYTQAAVEWMDHYLADTTQFALDSLRMVWQEVRTPAARYAEAVILLEQGQYAAATTLIEALPIEHRLDPDGYAEQQRMLDWIEFYEAIRGQGRSEAELDASEIAQLQALIDDAQDRPAVWISEMLCFHYDLCRPIHSGGEEEEGEKSRALPQAARPTEKPLATLTCAPNPALNWVSFTYAVAAGQRAGAIEVRDVTGRSIHRAITSNAQGQLIWDCRSARSGAYSVALLSPEGQVLCVEQVLINP